jgi:hypothetical protein
MLAILGYSQMFSIVSDLPVYYINLMFSIVSDLPVYYINLMF